MIYQQTDFARCNSDKNEIIHSHPPGLELFWNTDKDKTGQLKHFVAINLKKPTNEVNA